MNNKNYFVYLATLCWMTLFSLNTLQANNSTGFGTIVVKGGGGLPDCTYSTSAYVRVTNLDLFYPGLDDNDLYPLPEGYPEMKVRVDIDGVTAGIFNVTNFRYVETHNGIKVYEAKTRYITKGFSGECKENPDLDAIDILFESHLMWEVAGNLVPYPVCLFYEREDIYSCGYFPQTAGMCERDEGIDPIGIEDRDERDRRNRDTGSTTTALTYGYSCNPLPLTYSSTDQSIDCRVCRGNSQQGIDGGIEMGLARQAEKEDLTDFEVHIQPNPFTDELTLNWATTQTLDQVELYDRSGVLVKRWTATEGLLEGASTLRIDTYDLPGGLYFIQTTSTSDRKTYKVIKPGR